MKTQLSQGNQAFRDKNYELAITIYFQVLKDIPELEKIVTPNLTIAKQKFRTQRDKLERQSVAVCGWELAHNAAGRVYTLAKLYEFFTDIEIIGAIFPQFGNKVWEPIQNTTIPLHSFLVVNENQFLEQAMQLVITHPYDVVHLSKPRMPNIFFGILYKLIWNAKVLVDIDDEELAFAGVKTPITIDNYIKEKGSLPELKALDGVDWTRIAVGLVNEFDGVTVSNLALQQRYGGEIIRHARDKKLYNPSPELTRASREKFGIPLDKKVILFFGTPREHKGLIETAQSIATLKRNDVIFAIVGNFSDIKLKKKLQAIKNVDYKFIGNQPFDDIPKVIAVGNICVLLQDEQSPVSQFQVPAKLSDALEMKLLVLANSTPSLIDLEAKGAFIPVTRENLRTILEDSLRKLKVHEEYIFIKELSFLENRKRLVNILIMIKKKEKVLKTSLVDKFSFFFKDTIIINFFYNNNNICSIKKNIKKTHGINIVKTVEISQKKFNMDSFYMATYYLNLACKTQEKNPAIMVEKKNQYYYHALSSWLMRISENECDWGKNIGFNETLSWNVFIKMIRPFILTDINKTNDLEVRQYIQANLILAEECWDIKDIDKAMNILSNLLSFFRNILPIKLINLILICINKSRSKEKISGSKLLSSLKIKIDLLNVFDANMNIFLYLSDILNWNGLYLCGHASRQLAIKCAYQLGNKILLNAFDLKYAIKAAIDNGQVHQASEYMKKLIKIDPKNKETQELNLYIYLLKGHASYFYNRWAEKFNEKDRQFCDYIKGKSIAVVGPAPTGTKDGDRIDGHDIVIRCNYRGVELLGNKEEFGRKTNVSLYNSHTVRYLIKNKKIHITNELDFTLIRKYRYDFQELDWNSNQVRVIVENSNFFCKSLNAIPAIVFDLLVHGAKNISIFKVNFYSSKKNHSNKYRNYDELDFLDNHLRKLQPVQINHDFISQINFIRHLLYNELINVDDDCKSVIVQPINKYLFKLESLVRS